MGTALSWQLGALVLAYSPKGPGRQATLRATAILPAPSTGPAGLLRANLRELKTFFLGSVL